jgi:glycine cleavage system H lipoate-binding protein
MIGKNVDVSVTSVLQTTAGKMIFGRFNEDGKAVREEVKATPTIPRP